jgi:choline dehydrogenase-like flavoprotein
MSPNPSDPSEGPYDLLLVGAGSASSLLASRLSHHLPTHRILVLEAGPHAPNDPKIFTPGLAHTLQGDPVYDWSYSSAPEPGLNGRKIAHPRGKLVGGSSAINSHSVVFPNREWHDRIAGELLETADEVGRREWAAEGVEGKYERWWSGSVKDEDGDSLDRVRTSRPRALDELQSLWVQSFEELGHETCETGFVDSSAGAVNVSNAIDASKGERSHAGTAFLEPALRRSKNLELRTEVKVEKIVFGEKLSADGKLEAKGVEYCTLQDGEERRVTVDAREVILCAGVFESPAILERSGIGSRAVLDAANIPLLYELPGVGENLQDHINCGLSCETRDDIPTRDDILRKPELREAASLEYDQHRSGRLAEGAAYSFAFTPLQMLETAAETEALISMVQQHLEQETNPSLHAQYSLIQQAIANPNEATATTFMLRSQRHRDSEMFPKETPSVVEGNYITAVAMLAHPFSRGNCHITTADPSAPPEIKFNYLSHPLDTEILARHLRLIERLFQSPFFASKIAKPDGKRLPRSFPRPIESLEDAKAILPGNSATNYHPVGSCSMMREDLGGVVDSSLKVYGTANVRVCDAGVVPVVPRGNVLAAVYGWAEKLVEIIVGEEEEEVRREVA